MKPTIAKKVGFMLLLLTCGSLVALVAFRLFLLRTADDRDVINVAYRQRMLTDGLDEFVEGISIGQEKDRRRLRETMDAFEQSLDALEHGGQALDVSIPPVPGELLARLLQVKQQWSEVKTPLLTLADMTSGDPRVREAYNRLQSKLPLLKDASLQLVIAFDARRQALRHQMLQTLTTIAGLDIVLLLASLWFTKRFIVFPVRLIESATQRIREGDFGHRIPIVTGDELGTLAQTFNEMSAGVARLLGLIETERRHNENIVASVPSGLLVLSPDLRVISANPSFRKMFGLIKAEISARRLEDIVPVVDLSDRAKEVLATADPQHNLFFELKGEYGTQFLCISITRIRGTEEKSLLLAIEDLTEIKRAEAALREGEERFRKAFDDAAVGMLLTAPDGRFLRVNRALCAMLGYTESELLLKNIQGITHPADLESSLDRVRQLLAGEIHFFLMEKRYLHKKGHVVWAHLSVSLVRDAQSKPLYFITQVQDITERKHLEDQLRHSQKMEAIGKLAGGVAHDFNNLLTAITGYTELLLSDLGGDDPHREEVKEIRRAAERAATLTRQLLAFGRKQVLQPRILDLNGVVANMDRMLRRLIGETIELVTLFGSGLGWVKADPGQLEQVIVNLAINARDAMPQGGKLILETANMVLDETYVRTHVAAVPGKYVMLAISDNGLGMDAETQAHIFEPFFTTKEQGKGTGLGLSTVYGIVKQSGGYIWVYSEPGQGATFKIYLPEVEEEGQNLQVAGATARPTRGSETILVVEDEEMVRELVRSMLQQNGYQVLEAQEGGQALEIARQHTGPIDLLVTDVVMPQMSGKELAEHLEILQPKMKVLYMSGYTDDAIVRHGVLEPGTAFLQKPFTPDALTRKVREVLEASQE